jgi:hypothetical protein
MISELFPDFAEQYIGPIFKDKTVVAAWRLEMGMVSCPEMSVTN